MARAYDPSTFWSTIAKRVDRDYTKKFIFAGNCKFTLQNSITGARITYRIRRPRSIKFHTFVPRMRYNGVPGPWCVTCWKHQNHPNHWVEPSGDSLFRLDLKINLDPTDNKGWETCGRLIPGADGKLTYSHWERSKVRLDRVEIKTIVWFLERLQSDRLPETLWVYHMGSCAHCGKDLTVPTSIEAGFGPECLKELALAS